VLKPQPHIDELSHPFWQGCNEERLLIQRCDNPQCGRAVFYPRVACPHCHADSLSWIEASGRARIVSCTTIHRTHHDGFNAEAPYLFAAVELEEGALMYAQLLAEPFQDAELIGKPAAVEFVRHGPAQRIAVFRPVETQP